MSLLGCPHKEWVFLISSKKDLISAYTISHSLTTVSDSLDDLLAGTGQAAFRPPFSSLNPCSSLSVPSQGRCSTSDHFDTSPLNLFQFIEVCLVLEGDKTGQRSSPKNAECGGPQCINLP